MASFRRLTRCGAVLAAVLAAAGAVPAAETAPTWSDVAPVFEAHCTMCHSGESAPSGLRLDSYANIKQGSVNGPVVVPRQPAASELVRRLRGESLPRMPLTGPPYLDDETVARLEAWIAAGVPKGAREDATAQQSPVEIPATVSPATTRPAGTAVTYDDVAPILAARCVVCHSGNNPPRGLKLETYENVQKGSKRGAVARAGDPGGSELIRRVRGTSQPRMPMTGPPYLDEQQIALFEAWIAGGLLPGTIEAPPPPPPHLPAPGETVTYRHVAPIFLQRCVKCHADNGQMGRPPEGLRLQTLGQVLGGGERAVVVPGSPGASELVRKVNGMSRPRMPFDGPPYLSEDEIRVITDWVAQGAPDDAGNRAHVPVGARARLHGTLTGPGELDGFPVLDGGGGGSWGSYVRVRGVVTSDGRIRVERIRGRSGDGDGEDHGGGRRRRRGRGGRD